MNAAISKEVMTAASNGDGSRVKMEMRPAGSEDTEQFRAALERHLSMQSSAAPAAPDPRHPSLGEKVSGRVTSLASNMQQDQQYVSRMLEQASRTGDSMQLMKAMMALNDYQIRVQAVSKTVSKATSAFEQLTKLQ